MNKYGDIQDAMGKMDGGRYGANYRTVLIRKARKEKSHFLLHCHTCNIQTYHGHVVDSGGIICMKCGMPDKHECKCLQCWKLYKSRNYTSK